MKKVNKFDNSNVEFEVNDKVKEAFTNVSDTEVHSAEAIYDKVRLKNNLEDFAIYVADSDRLQN